MSLLFRDGVVAEDFNRFKLGRILDRLHGYGTEMLFSEISLNVCQQEHVDNRFNHLDTSASPWNRPKRESINSIKPRSLIVPATIPK